MAPGILSLPAELMDNVASNLVATDLASLTHTCHFLQGSLGPGNRFIWYKKLTGPDSRSGDEVPRFDPSHDYYTEAMGFMNPGNQRARCSFCLKVTAGVPGGGAHHAQGPNRSSGRSIYEECFEERFVACAAMDTC
ncbi:hypothetical protein TWF281_001369 [Arthrobotrys megalospora]